MAEVDTPAVVWDSTALTCSSMMVHMWGIDMRVKTGNVCFNIMRPCSPIYLPTSRDGKRLLGLSLAPDEISSDFSSFYSQESEKALLGQSWTAAHINLHTSEKVGLWGAYQYWEQAVCGV